MGLEAKGLTNQRFQEKKETRLTKGNNTRLKVTRFYGRGRPPVHRECFASFLSLLNQCRSEILLGA